MANDLYAIFNKAASSMKSPIGYSLKSSYNGVLAHLENNYRRTGTNSSRDEVFGVSRADYTGVAKMNFDANGMSDVLESCIWRMSLTITGSLPIMFAEDSQSYYIAKFPHETAGNTNRNPMCNSTQLCPLTLDEQQQGRITVQDFKIGASFDFSGLAKQYFETFYGYAGASFGDETLYQKLIVNNCLRAQIILPESNKSFIVGIIGETPFKENACCYLTTPLLGANQWKDSGIVVSVTDSAGKHEVIPNGTKYTFPCLGYTYYPSKSKIEGMNKEGYAFWLERNAESFSSQLPELVKIGDMKCYVRLFVPKEMQAKARDLGLPANVPPRIFQTYQGVVVEGGRVVQAQGPLEQRFAGVCRKWGSVNTASSAGIIYGNENQRPKTLQRGAGGTFSSGKGEIRALFGHPDNERYHDCSSLVCMLLYDADILKDEVKVAPSFGTSSFADAPDDLSNLLKPQYKLIKMDITPDTQLCTGDIVWVGEDDKIKNQRGEFNHHAAFIYEVKNGKVSTLQIRGGSTTSNTLLRQLVRSNPESGFYKHLLRVVKNDEQ